jgi:hypothetical protein
MNLYNLIKNRLYNLNFIEWKRSKRKKLKTYLIVEKSFYKNIINRVAFVLVCIVLNRQRIINKTQL